MLMIETNLLNSEIPTEQKLDYNKDDYAALRSYFNCDSDKEFDAVELDVERNVKYT